MSARSTMARAATAVLFLASVGCSSALRRADALYSAGDFGQAAAAYEAALAGAPAGDQTPRALYRLGVSRAAPGTAGFDPSKAREAFEDLVKRFPSSSYAREAALPLALLERLSAAVDRLAALQSELEKARAATEAVSKSSQENSDYLQAQVLQLQFTVAEREQTIAELRREMEQLKRIDLGQHR